MERDSDHGGGWDWGPAGARPVAGDGLGNNLGGLPATLRALHEILSASAAEHPLCAQVGAALQSGSVTAMRAALAAWYKLPHAERDDITR